MNKQRKGNSEGIGWCSYTSNILRGCFHDCKWKMPDGNIAICYAKMVAERVASAAYPQGFARNYGLNITEFDKWMSHKEPEKIFIDSMADTMGSWVSDEDILTILYWCGQARQHTFQLLTKNAPRLLKFKDEFPKNVWIGVSSPPDFFLGKELTQQQKEKMLIRSLGVLLELPPEIVTFASFEPLSWDVSKIVSTYPVALSWAIIGAASNGKTTYQPNPEHINRLLDVLDASNIPVYMKSNLKWDVMRKEFPR